MMSWPFRSEFFCAIQDRSPFKLVQNPRWRFRCRFPFFCCCCFLLHPPEPAPTKCISPNWKMYLSKLENVSLQIGKWIYQKYWVYLLKRWRSRCRFRFFSAAANSARLNPLRVAQSRSWNLIFRLIFLEIWRRNISYQLAFVLPPHHYNIETICWR